jgi:hypothetical protein
VSGKICSCARHRPWWDPRSVIIKSVRRLRGSRQSSTLTRWFGVAAVAAGVLHAAWGYLHRDERDLFVTRTDTSLLLRLVAVAVPLLFFIVLAGIYAQLAGDVGLLGRLGFLIAFWGSGLGVAQSLMDNTLVYGYLLERGWPSQLLRWLPSLLVGLVLVGIAALKTVASQRWSALLLVTAFAGWAYYLTDTTLESELRTAHVAFGVLFSSCWVAIGYSLGVGQRSRRM